MTVRPLVSLKYCSTTHRAYSEPMHLQVGRATKGDWRRKRLRQGIDRWHLSITASRNRAKRVLLVTLTCRDPEPIAARGAILRFWKAYRSMCPGGRYFSWAELQVRGALHYHAMIVNPPWRLERQARKWIQSHWPHADIQPKVEWKDAAWFTKRGGVYVKAYAKKWAVAQPTATVAGEFETINKEGGGFTRPGGPTNSSVSDRRHQVAAQLRSKAYQQDYDNMPREIRTFECNQLEMLVKDLDAHLDRPDNVCIAPLSAPWPERIMHWWRIGTYAHVPHRGGCSIAVRTKKRPPPRIPRVTAKHGGLGELTTKRPSRAQRSPVRV